MKIKSLLAAIFSLFVFQMTQTTLEIRFINSITAAEALERGISDQITVNITYEHFDQTYQNARLLTTSRPIAFNTKPILPRGRGARGSIVLPLESGDKLVELFILVHLEHGEFFGWKLTANMFNFFSELSLPLNGLHRSVFPFHQRS